MRKFFVAAVVAAVGLFATASSAKAEFQMRISWTSGGGGSVLVHDNGAGDTGLASTITGAITFSGAVGNVFITVNTGVSKPVSGSAAIPDMDLNYQATKIAGSGSEVLTIEISDVGFTTSPMNLSGVIGGTMSGAFTQTKAQAFFDNGNVNFGTAGGASTALVFNSNPVSGTTFVNVTARPRTR